MDMAEQGGCMCGAVRYEIREGAQPVHHALCHCRDCQRASGTPATSWSLFQREDVTISGEPRSYQSSEHAERQFCGTCGTSLFYRNEQIFPGQIDIQSATFDHPDAFPVQGQIQTAERIGWMGKLDGLPSFERYPG
ncbi:GFA family protein [Sphingomonas sp. LHG3406-1]|uniref:GFA family protein n=1 Tax=Sphingomonas sp. LHG3406-1 TaxID=2804617 RepID=UPI00262AFEF3|nr:GFA family protein [Sphingomonas sp. LHG3406-1]